MTTTTIFLIVIVILLVVNILLVIFKKTRSSDEDLRNEILNTKADINKIDSLIRSEFAINRDEIQRGSKNTREELSTLFKNFGDVLTRSVTDLSNTQKGQLETFSTQLQDLTKSNEEKIEKLISSNDEKQKQFQEQLNNASKETKDELNKSLKQNEEKTEKLINSFQDKTKSLNDQLTATSKETRDELNRSLKQNEEKTDKLIVSFQENTKSLNEQLTKSSKENRTELTNSFKSFEEKFTLNVKDFNELQRQKFNDLAIKQDQLKTENETKLEKIRETVERKLQTLQEENIKKLDEMRSTVDEKLQATLEKRFTDSFTIISDRLEQVHKGLGEMQGLVTNVGDLKKIMTNIKSRGVIGEYQLANILEDLLTNEQYQKNVKTKKDSGAVVEFAIKMPNKNNLEKTLWLPIDSKFPKEDYEALVDAYENSNTENLETLRKAFKNSIIKNAKDIKEKYIDPPNTTEYALMFLPFESLYAEVLRTPGLFELLQNTYKVTIAGPTTLSALLSSLQMGFRTLAIEKRSSEVWDLLSAVKKEFNQFGTILEHTKKKLQEATNTIDKAGVRSRAIERQLKQVQELPTAETIAMVEKNIDEDTKDIQDEMQNSILDNTN